MSADIWTDLAVWRGPTVNEGGPMDEHRGVVLHIAEGSYEGTIEWQHNPAAEVSSHFVVAKDGRIAQVVPANSHTAWTQQNGNGHWISVENEGFTPHALTDAQVDANARLLARAHQLYGTPLQVATSPLGKGLGHHSMGTNGHSVPTDTWTGPTWGHSDCPGPAIVAQKTLIITKAANIINGGDNMALSDNDALVQAWRVEALLFNHDVAGGPNRGEVNHLAAAIAAVGTLTPTDAQMAAFTTAVLAAIPTLPDIAKAVCDEADARERARLGT